MFIYSVSHDLRSPLVNLQGFSEELSYSCDDLRAALADGEAARPRGAEGRREGHPRFAALHQDGGVPPVGHHRRPAAAVARRPGGVPDSARQRGGNGASRGGGAGRRTIEARKAEVAVGPLPPALGRPDGRRTDFRQPDRQRRPLPRPVAARPRGGRGAAARRAEAPPGLQTYYVKDNGLGIPEAYQPRVFLAFQRLHANVAQGEGVGLALVYRMVGRLGGKIWLESGGRRIGSTFFVALPAAPSGRPRPRPPRRKGPVRHDHTHPSRSSSRKTTTATPR